MPFNLLLLRFYVSASVHLNSLNSNKLPLLADSGNGWRNEATMRWCMQSLLPDSTNNKNNNSALVKCSRVHIWFRDQRSRSLSLSYSDMNMYTHTYIHLFIYTCAHTEWYRNWVGYSWLLPALLATPMWESKEANNLQIRYWRLSGRRGCDGKQVPKHV